MKINGIAAGALALGCAASTPALAQTTNTTPSERTPPPTENTPPGATTTPPSTGTTTPPVRTGLAETARDVLGAKVAAPRGAFEMGVDAGYTQGFGTMSGGRKIGDAAGAGGTVGVSLGYRIDPRWSVAATGQYQGFSASDRMPSGASTRGATAGIQGTLHLRPYERLDPYLTLGTGYRALIESPAGNAPTSVTHGFELARVELGLDVRAGESVAISPVIGADLSMFNWRSGGGADTATLQSRALNTFVFAGVKGRFDIGGARESQPAEQVGKR